MGQKEGILQGAPRPFLLCLTGFQENQGCMWSELEAVRGQTTPGSVEWNPESSSALGTGEHSPFKPWNPITEETESLSLCVLEYALPTFITNLENSGDTSFAFKGIFAQEDSF